MTTRDFIAKTYMVQSDKDRHCSSVFTDRDGTVYSYGYHYPLAFNLGGVDFVNTQGYSTTTGKHIGWAWSALGYDTTIGVKLWREEARVIASSASTYDKVTAVLKALQRELNSVNDKIASKRRTDTQVWKDLVAQKWNLVDKLASTRALIA